MTDPDVFRRRVVWFVCHDEVAEDRVIAGRSDLAIRPTARSVYDRLRRVVPETGDLEFYRAPVKRCSQTASRLRADVTWEVHELLAPRAMGAWEGRTWDDLRASDAPRVEHFWSDFVERSAPGGGEPLNEVGARVESLLRGRTTRPAWTDAVVVASADAIAAAVCRVLDVELHTSRYFDIDALSVTTLVHTWLGWRLGSLNSQP